MTTTQCKATMDAGSQNCEFQIAIGATSTDRSMAVQGVVKPLGVARGRKRDSMPLPPELWPMQSKCHSWSQLHILQCQTTVKVALRCSVESI